MQPGLTVINFICFATALLVRAVDPVVPQIAGSIAVAPETVALLGAAFSLPSALVQPVLGPLADVVGKTRMMTVCLAISAAATLAAALAPNFPALVGARTIGGMASGGIFPVALALIGDLVPVERRQVAIGRLLAATIVGNLLGATLAGALGDLVGWRAVFLCMGAMNVAAFAAALIWLRRLAARGAARVRLADIPASYRQVFGNRRAKVCFLSVMLEGVFLFGIFPYLALLLHAAGETRASIAGLVIAAFAIGGAGYSFSVPVLMRRWGQVQFLRYGGLFAAAGLLGLALGGGWPLAMAAMLVMGFGFYMLHGTIQLHVTELAPGARGAATALHSAFFFSGQGMGPVVYGLALPVVGVPASLAVAAGVVLLVGLVCSRLLPHRAGA
jgi:predicted MFS family arabinose efflux permease